MNNITIGIGLVTFDRKECKEHFLKQLEKNMPFNEYKLHIAENIPNIAQAKNECLKNLKDCDYIFLFEDDCFVIQPYWDEYFINSGHRHLLYMNESHGFDSNIEGVEFYKDASGCFMFLTKDVFEHVGYFNTKYERYGKEHIAYSNRINRYIGETHYVCLSKTDKYLYSIDLQGKVPNVFHTPSLKECEIYTSLKVNNEVFEEEMASEQLYYEYETNSQEKINS